MLRPTYTRQFEKDVRRMIRRGKKAAKIKKVMTGLVKEEQLDRQYRDHSLVGRFKGRRECHVEADWLLIYKTTHNEIIFERTGTHSDLFE